MNERAAVKLVAKLAPWLAPVPSAYFVARSGMAHLGLPLAVAAIAAAIIETLGLATVHTGLWLSDYNGSKRKTDPVAPTWMAILLGAVYLVATVGLVVVLEVWPGLATYAPAMFPALAVVGAFNLALIAQQERREAGVQAQKAEAREYRRSRRGSHKGLPVQSRSGRPESRQSGQIVRTIPRKLSTNTAILDKLLDAYADDPHARPVDMAGRLGIGRSTVYQYLARLEAAGVISRNGNGVEVIRADTLS